MKIKMFWIKIITIVFVTILFSSDVFANPYPYNGPHYSSHSTRVVVFNPYPYFYNINYYYRFHNFPNLYYCTEISFYTIKIYTPKNVTQKPMIKKKEQYHSYIFERQ